MYRFGFVHFKAVDDAGHDKSYAKKIEMLEKIDVAIGEFLELIKDERVAICITGDHTTPIAIGDHTYEPVPFFVAPNVDSKHGDSCPAFNEVDCLLHGSLGRFPGSEIVPILKEATHVLF